MTNEGRVFALTFLALMTTATVIHLAGEAMMRRSDLLLLGLSSGALVAAFVWLLEVAGRNSVGWTWALGLCFWIPYVNLVLASLFTRRYWQLGARGPGLLGLAGLTGQTVLSVRLMSPPLPPLV